MADVLEGVVGTLGTSNADLLDAVGSSTTETIIGMSFSNVNSSSADVTIDIEVVKSGGSTTPHLLNDVTVPAGTTLVWETKVVLTTGDKIQGLCSAASSIDFTINYLKQT